MLMMTTFITLEMLLVHSMLMTLLLFLNFVEANFWFKSDCDFHWCTVLCFFHILNFVERRYTRLCLTLIRDIFVNRISDYKIDFVWLSHAVFHILHIPVLRTEFVLYSICLTFARGVPFPAFFVDVCGSRAKSHMCFS